MLRDAVIPGLSYVLWGSSGHAKVLSSLIASHSSTVVALFDSRAVSTPLFGLEVGVGEADFIRWAQRLPIGHGVRGLVAIGGARGQVRLAVQAFMQQHGVPPGTVIHPQASVCDTVILGAGSQILACATVAAEAQLGLSCIVNHGAVVDHESLLGDGSHVGSGAVVCDNVTLGENTTIGAGAVVMSRLSLGSGCVVGAGAVVTASWPAGTVLVGNPARPQGNQSTQPSHPVEG